MSFFPVVPPWSNVTLSYLAALSAAIDGSSTTLTFTGLNVPSAIADRYIIASVAVSNATGIATATATIGGLAANLAAYVDSSGYGIMMFVARVPTSGPKTVVVTMTDVGNQSRAHCFGYSALNLQSATAVSSASDTSSTANALDGTIEVPDGGIVLGHAANMGTGGRTWTWTNLTESAETGSYASGRSGSIAYSTTPGSALRTATADGSITNESLLLVAMR